MKKMFFTITLAFSAFCGHAQLFDDLFPSQDRFDFRIKGGLNLSAPEYDIDHSQKTSFYAGIGGEYEFKTVTLSFGVDYADNGTRNNSNYVTDINISQLNVPITLKVYPAEPFYVEAGAYAGFILNAEGETADGLTVELNDFESFDYGAIAGIGVDLDDFFIEARYNYGLKYLIDMPAGFSGNFDPIVSEPEARIKDYKNRFLQIGIGYHF